MIRAGAIATLATLILIAGITLWVWSHLPESGQIAVHYNGKGIADGWASDRTDAIRGFLVMMAVAVLVSAAMVVSLKLDPRRAAIGQSPAPLIVAWFGALALLTIISGVIGLKMVSVSNGSDTGAEPFSFTRWIGIAVSALMILIGNVLPKSRPNFIFGIRTPWTLSSPNTWERTHRFGGPVFMLAGLAGIVGAMTFQGVWIVLSGAVAMLIAGAICVAYSFAVWRSAEDRNQRPDYLP
jgi:uncharacterized membrane protein